MTCFWRRVLRGRAEAHDVLHTLSPLGVSLQGESQKLMSIFENAV
jgi:hypothetical protein